MSKTGMSPFQHLWEDPRTSMLETPVPAVTNHVYLGHDAAQFITIYHHGPRGSVGLSSASLAS